jgi:hypothetical protein
MAEKRRALAGALPILTVIILTIGGIYGGFFSPTEAAGVGAGLVILYGVVTRTLGLRAFWIARARQRGDDRHGHADPDRGASPQPFPRAQPHPVAGWRETITAMGLLRARDARDHPLRLPRSSAAFSKASRCSC